MAALDRHAILAIEDATVTELTDIPRWTGSVFIKTLSGNDIDRWEQAIADNRSAKIKAPLYMRGLLLSMGICDEKGARIFTDADAMALGKKSMKAIDYIYDAIAKLSGLRKEDQEDLAKNSESDPSECSASN
jgi:hypothetical protein